MAMRGRPDADSRLGVARIRPTGGVAGSRLN
jgi:hypothetical protein